MKLNDIEKERKKLYDSINKNCLFDEKVLKQSERLDKLIVENVKRQLKTKAGE